MTYEDRSPTGRPERKRCSGGHEPDGPGCRACVRGIVRQDEDDHGGLGQGHVPAPWEGSYTYVSGRVIDRDSDDGCYAKATLRFYKSTGVAEVQEYKAGNPDEFWSGPVHKVESYNVKLTRHC